MPSSIYDPHRIHGPRNKTYDTRPRAPTDAKPALPRTDGSVLNALSYSRQLRLYPDSRLATPD